MKSCKDLKKKMFLYRRLLNQSGHKRINTFKTSVSAENLLRLLIIWKCEERKLALFVSIPSLFSRLFPLYIFNTT